jgi:hypothetical protein
MRTIEQSGTRSRELDIRQKLKELGFSDQEAEWQHLRHLANLTALKKRGDGTFDPGHWWRGPLLYALVSSLKPRCVLEIGTGRGYGAISMALASLDGGFDCDIWSVDMVAPDQKQQWAIDEGDGPAVTPLSINDVWGRHLEQEARERIHLLTGDSSMVVARWRKTGRPPVNFAFVDGGHDFATVKHDFITILKVAAPHCTIVFDDYTTRKKYGIERLVNREIVPRTSGAAVEILDTLAIDQTAYGETVGHGMVLVPGSAVGERPLSTFYKSLSVAIFVAGYRLLNAVRSWLVKLRS